MVNGVKTDMVNETLPALCRVGPRSHHVSYVSRAQRSKGAFTRVFDALWRSEVVRCRPGIVTSSEFDTIPDQRCTASLRYALHRIRETATGGLYYTQPLSSRMASCQIISMPASLSLRHGMAAKFLPP